MAKVTIHTDLPEDIAVQSSRGLRFKSPGKSILKIIRLEYVSLMFLVQKKVDSKF